MSNKYISNKCEQKQECGISNEIKIKIYQLGGFPGGAVKNLPADAGDTGSSPALEDPTCCGASKPVRHNY